MKFLLSFLLIAALATVALSSSMSWGRRNTGDQLLFRQKVVFLPIKGKQLNAYVAFPRLDVVPQPGTIVSSISVIDNFRNSSGARPIRATTANMNNGSAMNSTVILLLGQKSMGINTTVEMYGRKLRK
ncbi:hypothetical protein DOY81_013846 [Sarcophaga bullata]|nr:hypothetical protein DOY81_013846 [Sarcophaga bullata]